MKAKDNRSVGDLAPAKSPEVHTDPLMACIEARHKRKEFQKRLGRTRKDIRHLNHLLASAKSTEAEDELALASVDARLFYD